MKNLFLAAVLLVSAFSVTEAFSISMNFNGTFRTEADYYNKLGLGLPGMNPVKNFLSAKALLYPELVIDDHLTIKSQVNLLTSPNFTPDATVPLGVGQGAWILGDINSKSSLSRAWLEWTSDFGVARLGRMPFAWGYGLMWDAGTATWDDFQTTLDRFEYRLHLGHIVGGLAYSKQRKISVLGSENDSDFYTVYLQYDNPESEVEGGILYEKQARASGQQGDLMTSGPYRLSGSVAAPQYPISKKVAYPLSNNVVDAYLKKTSGYFSFGGEVSWLTGTATDYGGDGQTDDLNAFGLLATAAYEYHSVKTFLEFMYASGDSNLNNQQMTGFVLLHRNRRPGLILGRELLGNFYGNSVAQGSLVAYGNQDSFSGVLMVRPGLRLEWSQSWATGLELIIARKATVQSGEAPNLGVEVDLGTDYVVQKNFDVSATLGYLFAGNGLGVSGATGAFAARGSLSIKF